VRKTKLISSPLQTEENKMDSDKSQDSENSEDIESSSPEEVNTNTQEESGT
jgi:hypothetical protein